MYLYIPTINVEVKHNASITVSIQLGNKLNFLITTHATINEAPTPTTSQSVNLLYQDIFCFLQYKTGLAHAQEDI